MTSHIKASHDGTGGAHLDLLLPLLSLLQCHFMSDEKLRDERAGDLWIDLATKMTLNMKEVMIY